MAATQIKLPLLCRAVHLTEPLPLQPEGARYAVVSGGLVAPEHAIGYLVDFTGRRTGYIIACVVDGGYVYACDAPIGTLPDERPAIRLVRFTNKEGGCVMALGADGSERKVSEFCEEGTGYVFSDPTCDLGAYYASRPLSFSGFLAVAFLAFRYLPEKFGQLGSIGRTMGDVLNEFGRVPVADAVDALVAEVAAGTRSSGFERYAARILMDADPAAFRALSAAHEVELRRLSSTGVFWISCFLADLDDAEAACLTTMEGALNRLALIERDARASGADALVASSEARCADEDWRQMRSVAQQGAQLLARSSKENPLLASGAVTARRGGEWDLRTRVAGILEHLILPYRLVDRFTVNATTGSVTIACWTPAALAMPRWRRIAGTDELESCYDNCDAAASAYAMRLAALLMAAAFGSSAGVTSARVILCADCALSRPVLEATVSRTGFVTGIHERLCSDDFADLELASAASRLSELLVPADVSFRLDDRVGLVELFQGLRDPDAGRRKPLAEDERPLPKLLADLLKADRVCDLDVFSTDDPFSDRLKEVLSQADADQVAAAQQLADLLAVMEVIEDLSPEKEGSLRPLYCANTFSRLAMGLVEDDPAVRYRSVPDSMYETLLSLGNLCANNSDAEHALYYARRAIALAPTSSRGYIAAGSACVDLGELDQAIEFYQRALAYDVVPRSYAYTYYRLAFALWRAGRRDAALACYARGLRHPQMGSAARDEMRELMDEMHLRQLPSGAELDEAMVRAGVPDAPTKDIVALAYTVVITAADAGLLNLASACASFLCITMHDDVLSAALLSCQPWDATQF